MPTLRSASASSRASPAKRAKPEPVSEDESLEDAPATPPPTRKRVRVVKPESAADADVTPKSKSKAKTPRSRTTSPVKKPASESFTPVVMTVPRGPEPELVPAQLTFDLEEAKKYLAKVDPRFGELFERRACKPYENLSTVDPFQTLAQSILSQQISTSAARSVCHKFCRMYDPSLPEKPVDGQVWPLFPTASQVAATPYNGLRAAGLSQRKAEYLHDLAAHFADERITTHKLRAASDQELYDMLIAVRGIGPWTVQMFAMFSMRHPDVLPVGDLGVQRGLAKWTLAAHSPKDHVTIPKDDEDEDEDEQDMPRATTAEPDASGQLPAPTPASMPPPATPRKARPMKEEDDEGVFADPAEWLPPPITPSVTRILEETTEPAVPLPPGLTVAQLRSRLTGKVKVKGAILTPAEMEALTDAWKPYRSIGVYYMWALVDQ